MTGVSLTREIFEQILKKILREWGSCFLREEHSGYRCEIASAEALNAAYVAC